jgi:hypothetical protein
MLQLKHIFFLLLLIPVISLQAKKAVGDDFKLIPSVALKQEYTDNIFLDETELDDFITTVSPALELIEKTERIDAGLFGKLDWIRYDDNSELDTTDQQYNGHIDWQASPRMNLSSAAGYTRDSRTDRDIEETGLLLGTSIRDNYHFNLAGDYFLTEKTRTALSYLFNQEEFDNPRLFDNRSNRVNLGFTYNLGDFIPLTIGRLNIVYSKNKFTNETVIVVPSVFGPVQTDLSNTTDMDGYSLTMGASKQMSEVLSVLVDLGFSYTRREQIREVQGLPAVPAVTDTSNTYGGVGQVDLSYNGEYNTGKISLSHDLQPASGRNGLSQRTSMRVTLGRRFTDKFRGNLAVNYILNRADQGQLAAQDIDSETLSIRPFVRYNYNRDIALEASYAYAATMNKVAGTESHRNLVFIRLFVQHPLFE